MEMDYDHVANLSSPQHRNAAQGSCTLLLEGLHEVRQGVCHVSSKEDAIN